MTERTNMHTDAVKKVSRKLPGFVVRRRGLVGFAIGIVALLLLSVAFFWPDTMEGNVLMQHDTQQGLAIGSEARAYADSTGVMPGWTNSLFSGMPTFQITPSYPSGKLIKAVETAYRLWLPEPAGLLFIMMLGFFILMLSMGVRWPLALTGAVAYGFSSYFVIIIGAGHIWKFVTLAYIPPTIAGMVLAYRGRYLAGGALAALFAMFQIAGNHIQMSYYFLLAVIGFVVAYGIILWRQGQMLRWVKATVVLMVAAIAAIAANSPSLYNTYEYSKETMRGRHSDLSSASSAGAVTSSGGLDKEYITAWSYGKDETFTLLIPNVKGGATIKPEKGRNSFLTLADTRAAGQMSSAGKLSAEQAQALGQIPQYFGDQPMTNGPVYVGALVLALFFLGCIIVKGPIKWMLVVITVVSIALSWGHNMMWLTDFMIDYVPMYNKFRTVASILVVAEFAIPVLAVLALKELTDRPDYWRQNFMRPLLCSFGLCLVVCLAGIVVPEVFGHFLSEQEAMAYGQLLTQEPYASLFAAVQKVRMSMISADALRSFAFIALGGILIWAYMKGKIRALAFSLLLLALVTVDLFSADKRYLDTESFVPRALVQENPFPPTKADLAIMADTDPNYRVMDIPRFSDAAPSYRHKTIGGYHAAKLTRYQDLIDRHLSHFATGNVSPADMQVLNMLNARYIVTDAETVYPNPDALGNVWLVDTVLFVGDADAEMNALSVITPATEAVADRKFANALGAKFVPRAEVDTVYATAYAPDRLSYRSHTANGGVAVFSEVYFPWGWTATVDGSEVPIARVNYLLRALRLPAGDHEIVFTFSPRSIKITTTIAYVAIALIYISVLLLALAAAFTLTRPEKQ
ncbi:YfhO family protein [uncultured Muribaculum sp.]|uniref:YfhO family protein n=1 Tax=uncultured Muribaculum sp. TaxID=1918613 RepID=UPI00266F80F4|nr:YfhO family protein [uncultured Muribaculum sp.]